jgi:hypothetical protein
MDGLIILLLTLVTFVLLIGVPVFFMLRHEKKRTKQLSEISSDLKLSFYPDGKDSIFESISFGIFDYGNVSNMMHGEVSNAEFAIFDHRYTSGSGENSSTYKQTAIYFNPTNLNLPRFTLSPENLLHKIGSAFGYQDIDFPTHPDFSKRFLLRGEDETKIRALFTNKLLNFLESQQKITIEGGGNQLILYRDNKRIRPEEWQNFIDQGFQFFDEFVGSD